MKLREHKAKIAKVSRTQVSCNSSQLLCRSGCEDNVETSFGELEREFSTDTVRGTGDDCMAYLDGIALPAARCPLTCPTAFACTELLELEMWLRMRTFREMTAPTLVPFLRVTS